MTLVDPARALLPSLYGLLPFNAIALVLAQTGTASHRQRRLPAQEVVWLVVAASLFRDRCLRVFQTCMLKGGLALMPGADR